MTWAGGRGARESAAARVGGWRKSAGVSPTAVRPVAGRFREGLAVGLGPTYNMRLPLKFSSRAAGLLDESGTWLELGRITGARRERDALKLMSNALDEVVTNWL